MTNVNDVKSANKGSSSAANRARTTIYLLPNLVTTAALLCGFYALYLLFQSQYQGAAIAIILAAVLDAVDGRVARLTKSVTQFGAEYDNLSDMVAFGVAPAMLMLHAFLGPLGNLGWIAAFVYTACTALRLARFAAQPDNSHQFTGLPSPAAAMALAGFVWLAGSDLSTLTFFGVTLGVSHVGAGLLVMLGLLMISTFYYWNPKSLSHRSRTSFLVMVLLVFGVALIAWFPAPALLILFLGYAGSGPLTGLWRLFRRILLRLKGAPTENASAKSSPAIVYGVPEAKINEPTTEDTTKKDRA